MGRDLDVQVVGLAVKAIQAIVPLSKLDETEDHGLIGFGEDLDVIPGPSQLVTLRLAGCASSLFTLRKKGRTRCKMWR